MTRAPKSSKVMKPFTPIRRFFFKLELLGKHRSDHFSDASNLDPVIESAPHTQSMDPHTNNKENPVPESSPHLVSLSQKPIRVALQNEDVAENAIVITALDNIPFCCHEDLVTMSREKLVDVALSLNAKLPAVLTIDVSNTRPTSFIRSSIEYIVGLRGDVPQAPKAVRLRSELDVNLLDEFDMYLEMNKSPPTSPLARRSRSASIYASLGSPRLESLEEEEEELGSLRGREVGRPPKRRKVCVTKKKADTNVEMTLESTPTPRPRILRARSQYVATITSPIPMRVLRSHSLKLPGKPPIDTTFVTTRRPTYRYRSKAKAARTNETPGSRRSSPVHRPTPRKIRSLRPLSGYGPFLVPGESAAGCVSANSSLSRVSVENSPESSTSVVGRKRKRSLDQTEDERVVACGFGEMNMGKSTSDMDITE